MLHGINRSKISILFCASKENVQKIFKILLEWSAFPIYLFFKCFVKLSLILHYANETSLLLFRSKGHLSTAYIDDSYLQAQSYHDCLKNIEEMFVFATVLRICDTS